MTSHDFDFTRYEPEGRKVWWPVPIEGFEGRSPRLQVSYAGLSNKAYANALAKLNARSTAERRTARAQSAAEALSDNLKKDREIFPGVVVSGWEDVVNGRRELVPFSREACAAFLTALPDWIMENLSRFCARPTNFLEADEPTDAEVDAEAGE